MSALWKDYEEFLAKNWEATLRVYDGVTLPIGYPENEQEFVLPILLDGNAHMSLSYKSGADVESALGCMLLGMDKLFTCRQLGVTVHNIHSKLVTTELQHLSVFADSYDSSALDAVIRIKDEISKRSKILSAEHVQSFEALRFRTLKENSIFNLNELENDEYVKIVQGPYGGLNNSLHILYGVAPSDLDTLLKYVEIFRVAPKCSVQLLIVGYALAGTDSYKHLVREVAYTGRFTGAYEISTCNKSGTSQDWKVPTVLSTDVLEYIHRKG